MMPGRGRLPLWRSPDRSERNIAAGRIHGSDLLPLLRAVEGPRTQTQSFQCDCRAASDWLDFLAECGWSAESRSIQLLQRVPLRPSDNRILLNFFEGHR